MLLLIQPMRSLRRRELVLKPKAPVSEASNISTASSMALYFSVSVNPITHLELWQKVSRTCTARCRHRPWACTIGRG